ncbi:MAG: class I SAM-dependent methyltransferase [Candidatus Marsarchaeota archaeon]|nr:class I SAM-dependent methyltransferase [Candidatus Marsarchaeota archaeon]
MAAWDEVYKKKGKYFLKPQKDMPKLVGLFRRKHVKKVLDIGCGTGRHLIYLARNGFDVYGFDPSPTGIKIVRQWLRKEHLKAHARIYDMNNRFPYKTNFFDAEISTQVLHHNYPKRIRKVIKEVERVLKKNGILFFTVPKGKTQGHHFKRVDFRTYLPLDGDEKGLPHFYFNEPLIKKFFKGFNIKEMHLDTTNKHYVVTAVKK